MAQVGTKDLYEGLQTSAKLYVNYSISRWGVKSLGFSGYMDSCILS